MNERYNLMVRQKNKILSDIEKLKKNLQLIENINNAGFTHLSKIEEMSDKSARNLKAISETLAMEVKNFGIKVTDVKPGFMRTEFFGKSFKTTAPENSPYKNLYKENMKFYRGQDGVQAGDPEKAAELYIKVAEMENPYEFLPMDSDSCEGIKEIAASTDY